MFLSPCYPFITCRFFFWQIKELTEKYAQLEQKLVEMRSKATAEVTSFLDDEIGTKLDKLSRQVARIESRLHTYHEVNIISISNLPKSASYRKQSISDGNKLLHV